ncbi:MAG: hypothetical protein PBV86_12480 [Delftia lacustris]|jgi:hypothetical protein|uniref:hypothetical protein n=1 Tax=Delftia TaxID=80865 RepID=UPI00259C8427|nr:hypothetical protein [Delftia sp.]
MNHNHPSPQALAAQAAGGKTSAMRARTVASEEVSWQIDEAMRLAKEKGLSDEPVLIASILGALAAFRASQDF